MEGRILVEELFTGVPTSILWEQDSRWARVLGVQGRQNWVLKLPGHRHLLSLSETQRLHEVDFLEAVTRAYLGKLSGLGVVLPTVYDLRRVRELPVHISSYEGPDCSCHLDEKPGDARLVLEAVVRSIATVIEAGDPHVGVDPRLSNFSLNQYGEAVYIDVFPPLVWVDGVGYVVHYPNPIDPQAIAGEVARKFDPFGILRRLRFDALAQNPHWEAEFFAAIKLLSGYQLFAERFADLPDVQVTRMNAREVLALIDLLPATEVDTRREIALRLIPKDHPERGRLMIDVFEASSLAAAKNPHDLLGRQVRYREIIASLV